MTQISFPSNIFICSGDFAKAELVRALNGKNIKNLTSVEKDTINTDLRKVANAEYNKCLRNAIFTNLVAVVVFSTILLAPILSLAFASTFVFTMSVKAILIPLTMAISAYALRSFYFQYEDFKLDHVIPHKHNYEALMCAARTVKKPDLPPIVLPEGSKEIIFSMVKEISLSYFPNPVTLNNLGDKLMNSVLDNDSLAEVLAYVFTDSEIHQDVENILSSSVKKSFIIWGLNQIISNPEVQDQLTRAIPKFARLVGQDENVMRNLFQTKNWDGIAALLVF